MGAQILEATVCLYIDNTVRNRRAAQCATDVDYSIFAYFIREGAFFVVFAQQIPSAADGIIYYFNFLIFTSLLICFVFVTEFKLWHKFTACHRLLHA